MQAFADHYRTLQVHHEAGREVIEAAWKRLCRIYHPDVNPGAPDADRIKEINAAYDVLRDASGRSAYHRLWLRHCAGAQAETGVPGKPPQPPRDAGELAQRALDGYFLCLMDGKWDEAYALLTAFDRKNVPAEDFRRWKGAVAECFRIGSYAIKLFRRHQHCTVSGAFYREVYEFSVFVCDMDARTGIVGEENCLKYVVKDGGIWRVCLGHADLKPLILRFQYMATDASLPDPAQVWAEAVMSRDRHTGLLSRAGFTERAEAEAVRSRRYGNPFSVALLLIRPGSPAGGFTARDYERMCVVHAARAISGSVRQTDILGRWSDRELALLFIETPRDNAGFAMEKFMERLAQPKELEYTVVCGIAEFHGTHFEDTMAAAASDAQVRRRMSRGQPRTFITMNNSI